MQRTHRDRRATNGEQAQAGTKANRHHSKVDLVARVGIEDADEAPEQWTVRVVGNVHRCVAMSASFEAQQMPREEAKLAAIHQAHAALDDEELRIRNHLKPTHFSQRTRDVLLLVQQGLSSPEIARQLCISRYTVDTHISRVCAKLNVSGRREAVHVALRLGLL